jgi:hypothetical protein
MGEALSIEELADLLVSMERAVADTARGFQRGFTAIAIGAGVVAAIAAARGIWFLVPMCAVFAGGLYLLLRKAAQRTSPERMAPVLTAMRDAPERIVLVRHYTTSDSHRVFVSHWLEVKTSEHRLIMKVQGEWQRLFDAMKRRCPHAKVVD